MSFDRLNIVDELAKKMNIQWKLHTDIGQKYLVIIWINNTRLPVVC